MIRKEFKVISKRTHSDLETEVNKYLLDYWELHGTMRQEIDEWYTQCLVRALDE